MRYLIALIILGALGGIGYVLRKAADAYDSLRRELRKERARRTADIDFLNDFTRKLADVEEVADAMDMVVHHVLHVLQAESVGIYVTEQKQGDRLMRGVACTGMFPAFGQKETVSELMLRVPKRRPIHFPQETLGVGEGPIGQVGESGATTLLASREACAAADLPSRVSCLIATPMQIDETIIGVMVVVNCRDERRRLDQDDADLLAALSCQAALASNLIRVYSDRSRQEQLVQEMRIGRDLQQALLPTPEPYFGVYRFATYGEAAREVAGDYYDFVHIDENRLLVLVADATGKGVSACMLMAMCRSFAHSAAEDYVDMPTFLTEVNRQLFADTDLTHFVTLGAVVLDTRLNTVEYGCAGHTPLLIREPDGATRLLRSSGSALGLLPPDMAPPFEATTVSCPPGTRLLLFSDGITEAINHRGEEYGTDRLKDVVGGDPLPPVDAVAKIMGAVAGFSEDAPRADDQTVVLIEATDGPAAPPPKQGAHDSNVKTKNRGNSEPRSSVNLSGQVLPSACTQYTHARQ